MVFRFLYSGFVSCVLLYSSAIAANNDIFIDVEAPNSAKQALFKVVGPAIPGKVAADRYHISLMLLKNIAPQHCHALKTRLEHIRNQFLSQTHFTPVAAFQFQPPAGAIALEPANHEKQQFKQINSLLYAEVRQFNLQHNTAYQVENLYTPQQYTPHLTIAQRAYVMASVPNPQQVIQTVNLNLASYRAAAGAPLDVLQAAQPAPLPPMPAPQPLLRPMQKRAPLVRPQNRRVQARPALHRAAPAHKRAVHTHRRAVHAHRGPVRHKAAPRITRRHHFRNKTMPRIHRPFITRQKAPSPRHRRRR